MSVNPGQRVSAAVTNAAFMSRKVDTQTVGKVALEKPTGSGPFVDDVQLALNNAFSFTGMLNGNDSLPTYSSTNVVTQSTSLETAVGALDSAVFNVQSDLGITQGQVSNLINGLLQIDSINTSSDTSGASGSGVEIDPGNVSILYLTDNGLVSIAGFEPAAFNRWMIVNNTTGNDVDLLNLGTVTTADQIITGTGADLTLANEASILLFYDVDQGFWKVVGGTGGGGAVSYQEVPAGTVNGTNAVFGPLTYLPTDDNSVLVFVNGVARVLGTEFTVSGGTITFQPGFIPQPAQSVYVWYSTEGTPVTPVLNGTYRVEYRTLTLGEATAEQLTLSFTPGVPAYVAMDIRGGAGAPFFGVDFTVTGNVLSWSGLGLSGLLATGDQVRILYTE